VMCLLQGRRAGGGILFAVGVAFVIYMLIKKTYFKVAL
jgi:mannose/fructose/N-acetylgalactosamine-specific phosphotransferase system component IIC